jgi:hypothetical protein
MLSYLTLGTRQHKAKKPESLRGEDILNIKVIENDKEVEYRGISWTIADMCLFWEPLLCLVERESCDDKVTCSKLAAIIAILSESFVSGQMDDS